MTQRVHLPLRINPAAVALLTAEAARRGVDRSTLVREALTIGLRSMLADRKPEPVAASPAPAA
ncbi:MAG: ribbon-helix-helix protein, CopG family [Actinomycetota bacterium]